MHICMRIVDPERMVLENYSWKRAEEFFNLSYAGELSSAQHSLVTTLTSLAHISTPR